MTPVLMRTLKDNLKLCRTMVKSKKRIIRAIATIVRAGTFRIHELLANEATTYDPLTTPLARDITLCDVRVADRTVKALRINLKHPKEERLSAGVVIDVFATNDFMCHVKASGDWMKDKQVSLASKGSMFRLKGGANYTGGMFNADLRKLLRDEVDYAKSPVIVFE